MSTEAGTTSEFDSINVTVTYKRARLLEERDRASEAEEKYKALLAEHPNYIDAFLRLASIERGRLRRVGAESGDRLAQESPRSSEREPTPTCGACWARSRSRLATSSPPTRRSAACSRRPSSAATPMRTARRMRMRRFRWPTSRWRTPTTRTRNASTRRPRSSAPSSRRSPPTSTPPTASACLRRQGAPRRGSADLLAGARGECRVHPRPAQPRAAVAARASTRVRASALMKLQRRAAAGLSTSDRHRLGASHPPSSTWWRRASTSLYGRVKAARHRRRRRSASAPTGCSTAPHNLALVLVEGRPRTRVVGGTSRRRARVAAVIEGIRIGPGGGGARVRGGGGGAGARRGRRGGGAASRRSARTH